MFVKVIKIEIFRTNLTDYSSSDIGMLDGLLIVKDLVLNVILDGADCHKVLNNQGTIPPLLGLL